MDVTRSPMDILYSQVRRLPDEHSLDVWLDKSYQVLNELRYSKRCRRKLYAPPPKNPPTASRGVERTGSVEPDNTERRLSVDWLAFTLPLPELDALEVINHALGHLEPCMDKDDKPIGWRGYTNSARLLDTGRVGWHPLQPAMGVHCELPSTALGNWAAIEQQDEVHALLEYLLAHGAKFTRVDLAYDDRVGAVKLDQLEQHLRAGAFSTRVHRQNCRIMSDLAGGKTFYIGDPTSDKRLRIYDKKAERRAAGVKVKGPWNRFELETKHKVAEELVKMVLADEQDPVGLIRGFMDIKELDSTDSNNRRREPASWWLAFLEYASRLPIVLPSPGRTLEKVAGWFSSQIGPSFALLWETYGLRWLSQQRAHGEAQWKAIHLAMLETFRTRPIGTGSASIALQPI